MCTHSPRSPQERTPPLAQRGVRPLDARPEDPGPVKAHLSHLCAVPLPPTLEDRCPGPSGPPPQPPQEPEALGRPPHSGDDTLRPVVGLRGPHRSRFCDLPWERGSPRSPLRPGSRPEAAAALHRDAPAAQAHCQARRAAPNPRASACARVLTQRARRAGTCDKRTGSHAERTQGVHVR